MGGERQFLRLMIEHGLHLLARHAGKPLQKLVERGPVAKVFEEGPNRHARAPKYPCAADDIGMAFDGSTGAPIAHGCILVPVVRTTSAGGDVFFMLFTCERPPRLPWMRPIKRQYACR